MNSRFTARRARRASQVDRQALRRQGPSATKRILVYTLALAACASSVLFLPQIQSVNEQIAVGSLMTLATLLFTIRAIRLSKRPRQRAHLAKDTLSGVATGLFIISVVAAGSLVFKSASTAAAREVQQPTRLLSKDVLQSRASANEKPKPGPLAPPVSESAAPESESVSKPQLTEAKKSAIAAQPTRNMPKVQWASADSKVARATAPLVAEPPQPPKPVILPAGTRMRVSTSTQGTLSVQVERDGASQLSDLNENDFNVRTNSGNDVPFDLVEVPARKVAHHTSVVFLVNQSLSRRGELLKAMRCAYDLMKSIPYADYRAISYGTKVNVLTGWTQDGRRVWEAMYRSPHSHGQSLRTAVNYATDDLSKRSGKRIIVVISNGSERYGLSQSSLKLSSLTKKDIRLYAVQLPAGTINTSIVEEVAVASGGQKFSIDEVDQLAQSIQRLTTVEVPAYYSLALRCKKADWPVTLRVGSGDSALEKTVTRR